LTNLSHNLKKFILHVEHVTISAPAYNGQGVRGTKSP